MKKIIFMIALVFSIASNAQNVTTNGTILLDDATSRTRVVVDAFLNSSNQVHSLIESIGMYGGLTTNDVCNIVTNEVVVGYGQWTCEPSEMEGVPIFLDEADDGPGRYWMIVWTGSQYEIGEKDSTYLTFDLVNQGTNFTVVATRQSFTRNALGLSMLSDIAPTVSNTVTKAYVESLGIEAGISTSTATNIADGVSAEKVTSISNSLVSGEVLVWSAFNAEEATHARYSDVLVDDQESRTASEIFSVLNESASTNYANNAAANAVASADTTYRRIIGITNINQSVQYVNITDTAPTTLAISMPTDGATKDWMVYVVSVTNVTLSLPSATWWMADTAYTNDVPPAKPTALWFSQISDGIFILGRQELTEVAAP